MARDSTASFELMPDGSIIRQRSVLFDEGEYVINIGPQHPATHGVLRFRVSLEGEIIRKLDASTPTAATSTAASRRCARS